MKQKLVEPLLNKKSLYFLGLSASATIAYFCWNRNQKKSDLFLRELDEIKSNVERAYRRSKCLSPLNIEQEIIQNEQGVNFIIKVVNILAQKPSNEEQVVKKNPFIRPFEKSIQVQRLGDRHYLLLNKFPVNAHHTIIVTKEFEPQENFNTMLDLYQTYKVLSAVQGFGYFNSGLQAGGSQAHKHLQVLPHSALLQSDILKIVNRVLKQELEAKKLQKCYRLQIFKNIKHFIRPIEDKELIPNNIYETYLNLLKDISNKKLLTNDSIVHINYNLIMTTQFMMIVERKKEKYNESIAINAVGFTGSILLKNKQQLQELKDVRLVKVLEDVSVSFSEEENRNDDQKWAWI